jgi:hypothetical protein
LLRRARSAESFFEAALAAGATQFSGLEHCLRRGLRSSMRGAEMRLQALVAGSAVEIRRSQATYEIPITAAIFSDIKFAPSGQKPVR